MTKFIINYNSDIKELNIEDLNMKIIDLKKQIIKLYELSVLYIDIIINIDRPIRELGKFNLEKGVLSRVFDKNSLNQFNLQNKEINVEFNLIDNVNPDIKKVFKKKNSNKDTRDNKYIPPIIKSGDNIDLKYDINSTDDFPAL